MFLWNVLRAVVILDKYAGVSGHIAAGSEYAVFPDLHIPPVCLIIEIVLDMLGYLNGVKLVRIKAAQFFLIGYIRVEAV